ncbi:MAG TPA: hypothetical protein VMU19_01975 [Bryobacteraceae bacterium]|nr:hypothetical protein [Bryobacteraceae bacterium]
MSNFVWPYLFVLRATELNLPQSSQSTLQDLRAKLFPSSNGTTAVALRWVTAPSLGFPRQPFQLYRRQRNTALEAASEKTVLTTPLTVAAAAQSIPTLPGGDVAYVVAATCTLSSGASVTLQAYDVLGQAIPGQSVTLTASGRAGFRGPGIVSLSVTGSGTATVGPVTAIGQSVYANLPDWQQIQTVGLPLLNNEIGSSYNTLPQGSWDSPATPPNLNGVTFATNRMIVGSQLQLPPPATGIADFPLPSWPAPNPSAYVSALRAADGLVPMVENCLENCVDTDPSKQQADYSETVAVSGPSQPGLPAASPTGPSQASIPVVGASMLSAAADSFAAVSLGYGTYDIPPDLANLPSSGVAISLSPASASIRVGASVQFTATVTGSSNTTVVWSVNGVVDGSPDTGFITDGLYQAPKGTQTVTIAATSAADPSKSATAKVTVLDPAIGAASTAATDAAVPDLHIIVLPPILPASDAYGGFDYMITAPFVAVAAGMNGWMAALSSGQTPVTQPVGLNAALSQVFAPLRRDATAGAAIKLVWQQPANPQGYAILASRAPNQSVVLNSARPAGVNGYNAYIGLPPANPDPNAPPAAQQQATFTDLDCSLPLGPPGSPDTTDRYLVAGIDVFGQWSNWVEASATLTPAPVTQPGLRDAQFILNPSAAAGQKVPATLQIDFMWNWQDRAPGQIRFTGKFVPAVATTLDPPFLGGFATTSGGAPNANPAILTFNYGSSNPDTVDPTTVIPAIDADHATNGPVVILDKQGSPATAAPTEQILYRVQITGFMLDFSSANELDFVLYATATEQIRPGEWSEVADSSSGSSGSPARPAYIGKIVRALNPLPPTFTFTPPHINWTALPDATGKARGVLEWQAQTNVAGFFVWEATESALLHILPPGSPNPVGTPDPASSASYVERAQTIKALVEAYQDASLAGFARLTQQPIAGNRTELELPGSAQTLYLFRISAISPNNVESARSQTFAIYGIPRRDVPPTPRLMLRPVAGSPGGIQVIVLPGPGGKTTPPSSSSPGESPGGYRVFRVRNQQLSLEPSAMGPPKYDSSSPAWQDYSSTSLSGAPLSGKSLLDAAAVPSWYPYYYRATAVGAEDLDNGVYAGESDYSSAQTGYAMPTNPPLLQAPVVSITGAAAVITLVTDLPAAAPSPVGPALVELLRIPRGGSPNTPGGLVTLHASAPDQIPVVSAPPGAGPFGRSQPDGNGHWTLYIQTPYSPAEKGSFILRLTDPLARQSTTTF